MCQVDRLTAPSRSHARPPLRHRSCRDERRAVPPGPFGEPAAVLFEQCVGQQEELAHDGDHRLPRRRFARGAAGLGHLKAHSSPIVNRQAKAAVRCPRVRADRSPADRAAVPPASAPLRRKRAVAHDVEAQLSTVVTPALGAGHPVDRVHRSRVPGGNPRFSPKLSEVKATDQQRPAQAPRRAPPRVVSRV